jgi:hypothetical protein
LNTACLNELLDEEIPDTCKPQFISGTLCGQVNGLALISLFAEVIDIRVNGQFSESGASSTGRCNTYLTN